jgi:uncharacterized protein YecT (DUF1311 family)
MSVILMIALQAELTGLPQDVTDGCNDKHGTISLSSCYSERTTHWEARLERAYQAAFAFTDGPQHDALERARVAWLKYREATCDFYSLTPGSIHYIWGAYCELDLTRRRTIELDEFILP